ncbi:hypothetical protein H0H87_010947 [Tephrocybe sp. NHM501043]|nr:hypothetical protein H0H87_010947 [Tephrocybe sp. NHM501043]
MDNAELVHLMQLEDMAPASSSGEPEPSVRWINIGGLDWGVIRAVALKYNLHVLALEDVLQEQGHNQSKADYYQEHLFIRILCHTLEEGRDHDDREDSHESSRSHSKTEISGSWLEAGRGKPQGSEKARDERLPISSPIPLTAVPSSSRSPRSEPPKSLSGFWGAVRSSSLD